MKKRQRKCRSNQKIKMSEAKNDESELSALLCDAGYEVAIGAADVLKMIQDKAEPPYTSLCSGYGVFPSGEKCKGCSDCT